MSMDAPHCVCRENGEGGVPALHVNVCIVDSIKREAYAVGVET